MFRESPQDIFSRVWMHIHQNDFHAGLNLLKTISTNNALEYSNWWYAQARCLQGMSTPYTQDKDNPALWKINSTYIDVIKEEKRIRDQFRVFNQKRKEDAFDNGLTHGPKLKCGRY